MYVYVCKDTIIAINFGVGLSNFKNQLQYVTAFLLKYSIFKISTVAILIQSTPILQLTKYYNTTALNLYTIKYNTNTFFIPSY